VNSVQTCYSMLINKINDYGIDRVLVINLNYDTLFERPLAYLLNHSFEKIEDYFDLTPAWKVLKPHGSINWAKRIIYNEADLQGNHDSYLKYLATVDELKLDEKIIVLKEYTDEFIPKVGAVYPSMVIPIEGKYEYCCPDDHIEKAKAILSECDAFLIIGSSFKDKDVSDILKSSVERAPKLLQMVIKATKNDPEKIDISERITNAVRSSPRGFLDGFHEFMASGACDKFLSQISKD